MGSQVLIFFKNSEFFPMILQQQLTTLDLISYCGGSLGLYLGFSVLSAVELVYYFSLRLIFKRVQSNKVECFSVAPKAHKNYLLEFVSNSSVHGCNQISRNRRHLLERCVGIEIIHDQTVICVLSESFGPHLLQLLCFSAPPLHLRSTQNTKTHQF
jgi:hypothetical protein